MLRRCWDNHSKTVMGLITGPVICYASWFVENDRVWDLGTAIGGALIAIGLNGLWDIFFREVAKPEE